MRERVFYRSVQSFLDDGDRIAHMVHMWSRHRLALPFILGATLIMGVVAIVVGVEQWSGRIGLALAAGAVGAFATTEYRILVATTQGLVMLRSSRIRQKAVGFIERLPASTTIEPTGSNLVITEWRVGTASYSVMKRFQKPMVAISGS